MSINLLIPAFDVPPSKLAENMNASMHDTIGPGRSNPLTEPGRRLPITLPNPNANCPTRCLNVPSGLLLQRLNPICAIPIEPAAWPYDHPPLDAACSAGPDKPYHPHRIPAQQNPLNPLNPAGPHADSVNTLIDLFV